MFWRRLVGCVVVLVCRINNVTSWKKRGTGEGVCVSDTIGLGDEPRVVSLNIEKEEAT